MLMRKIRQQLLIFILGGILALTLEWIFINPRPWLLISESYANNNDTYIHIVIDNYGVKPVQLIGGFSIVRFENSKCGRGQIIIDYNTAIFNGVYLRRFKQTSVAFTIDSWSLVGLETIESSSPCAPDRIREILASSHLSCQIILKGRYEEGTGSPSYHAGKELVPCAGLIHQFFHFANL